MTIDSASGVSPIFNKESKMHQKLTIESSEELITGTTIEKSRSDFRSLKSRLNSVPVQVFMLILTVLLLGIAFQEFAQIAMDSFVDLIQSQSPF